MGFGLGDIISIGADLLGNVMGNDSAMERQENQQNFNANEAQKNRDWETQMSNTQYQRRVTDLEAAGLNPMLAYTAGPGQLPSGTAASSSIANPVPVQFSHSLQTASQIQLNDAAVDKAKAEADKANADAAEARARTPTYAVSMDATRQQIDQSKTLIEKMLQETRTSAASAGQIAQQTEYIKQLIPQVQATVDNLKASTMLHGAQTGLTRAQTQLTGAQTGKTVTETGEVQQRINANLPALEAALKELQRQARVLEMPGMVNNADAQHSFIGSLGATLRALNPLSDFLKPR